MRLVKRCLVLDIDDVLVDCFGPLGDWHNRMYGTAITIESFETYSFWEVFGCEKEVARQRCCRFFNSEEATRLDPIPGAIEAITALKREFHLIGATGRPIEAARSTQKLLEWVFPGAIRRTYHSSAILPGFSTPGLLAKGEVCRKYKAICHIDDCHLYAPESLGVGTPFILFGDYPWNRQAQGLHRLPDWPSVLDHIFTAKAISP